jgi:hypothetical protein
LLPYFRFIFMKFKPINSLFFAFSIPWIFSLTLILFYFNAAFLLKNFPRFSNPDPKDLSIHLIYSPIIYLAMFCYLPATAIWVISFFNQNTFRLNNFKLYLIGGILGQLIFIALFCSPIVDWFLD